MDQGLIKIVAAGILGAHGIGHALGWMPAVGIAAFEGVSGRSWLLTGALGAGGARLPPNPVRRSDGRLLVGRGWHAHGPVVVAPGRRCICGPVPPGDGALPAGIHHGSTIGSVVVDVVVLYGILVAHWGAEAAGV